MRWEEIRKAYPDQWLIIEALEAYTKPDHQRHPNRLLINALMEMLLSAVIANCI